MSKLYNDFNFSVRTRTYEKCVSGMQPLQAVETQDLSSLLSYLQAAQNYMFEVLEKLARGC